MNNIFSKGYKYFILLLALFLLITKINKPFYGHHDWNGVFFGNVARNIAKFGFLKTKFGAVFTFLPINEHEFQYYTHYPPMFHLLLGLEAKMIGVHEWSMRMMAIIVSLFGLFYWGKTIKLIYGKQIELLTCLFYIFTPIFLYYGKMPIHEVFGITFIIYSFYRYWIFFKKTNKKNFWQMIAALFLACQTVWTAYYLCPLLLLHFYIYQKKNKKKIAIIFSLLIIPLLSFASHLIHTRLLTGNWSNGIFSTMLFRMQIGDRASAYNFYLKDYIYQESLWLSVYFTRILSLLFLIYIIVLIKKLLIKKANSTDGLLVTIIILPFLDLIIFRNVCFIHDYKLYYFLLSVPLISAVCIFFFLDKISKKFNFTKLKYWILVILIFLFMAVERIPFTKSLLGSSGNKIGYDLGLIINRNTLEDDKILIGSPSFGEFFGYFINYYGERRVVYFIPEMTYFNKVYDKLVKQTIIFNNREAVDPKLKEYLTNKGTFLTRDEILIYSIK